MVELKRKYSLANIGPIKRKYHQAFRDLLKIFRGGGLEGGKKDKKVITKPLAFTAKFQICVKVFVVIHVYNSSCWVLFKETHVRLEKEKAFSDFMCARSDKRNGFQKMNQGLCCIVMSLPWITQPMEHG
jgi:hypothetical protein